LLSIFIPELAPDNPPQGEQTNGLSKSKRYSQANSDLPLLLDNGATAATGRASRARVRVRVYVRVYACANSLPETVNRQKKERENQKIRPQRSGGFWGFDQAERPVRNT